MRLIDADKLQERMKKGMESGSNLNITYGLYIKQAPTIEMNDSISRSGAIEGVKELFACADIGNDECDITYMLKNLPSTDRLTGEWIEINNGADTTCECSECHYKDYIPNVKIEQNKYECVDRYWFERKICPNCGAKMRGDDSE